MKRIAQIGLSVGTVLFGLMARAEGEIWPGDGAHDMATIADFGAVDLPFTLGTGLLRYTGSTATVEKDVALSPARGLPATIRVVEPGTTLTLAGNVTQTDGAFIKDGPGTLVFGGLTNVVGRNRVYENMDGHLLEWDEETGLCGDKGYAVFTVNDGRVVMGGPGALNATTNILWIGSRTQKSTRLDIVGGRYEHRDNWFCISRGAGTKDNDVTASVYVSGGTDASVSQIVLNNGNSQPNYYGRSLLDVEDATVAVANAFFVGEGVGEASLRVGPGAKVTCGQEGFERDRGLQIGRGGSSARADVTVDGGELCCRVGYVRAGSRLTVKNGGVVRMDRTLAHAVAGNYCNGDVLVDGGTFAPWTTDGYSGVMSDWFNGSTGTFGVGAGGATLDAPAFTHLGMQPAAAAAGAAIAKTGGGVLTMYASDVPVTAREGTLRMSVSPKAWTNGLAGAVAVEAGAALEVSGDMALGAMRVDAAEATFDAAGIERDRNWVCSKNASWRPDGVVQATAAVNGDTGGSAAILDARVPVDRSFELAFDAFLHASKSRPADGWTLYFQNTSTTTTGTGSVGYFGVRNSFGVAVNYWDELVRWGENGDIVRSCSTAGVLTLPGNWAERRRCRLVYDAAAHRATLTIRQPDGREASWSHDVDIAALVGADEAYLGFTGGTGGSNAAFSFANIRFVEAGSPSAHVRVGGVKTLAAGETFTARTRPNEAQSGFLMGRLDYADGATLNVEDDFAGTDLFVAPLTTADQSLWQLGGGAYWREDGSLATSRFQNNARLGGTATTVAYYPVGGSWESAFTFELGAHSDAPADAFLFSLIGPGGNLDMQVRYYEDVKKPDGSTDYNTRKTQIKLSLRGVRHPASVADFDPIDVVKYGPARVHLAYDDAARTFAVSMTQEDGARANRVVFTDVDMAALMRTNTSAQIRLTGQVGGLYAENVVRDFTFRSDLHDARRAARSVRGFFGFESLAGGGTLVKTGAGDLGLVDTRNSHAALRLAEGGLRLRREPLEDLALNVPGGWSFSHASGRHVYPDGIQIGELTGNHVSTAQTRHRLRVDGDWRCSFSLWVNGGSPADAVSLFLHNDPRGNQCVGKNTRSAGFDEIRNGIAVAWNFYPGNTAFFNTVAVARNGGSLDWNGRQTFGPVTLPGRTTDIALTYNAATKTLTSVMTQGGTSVTNTFADFDVAGSVKGAYAWLGFGVGCGGSTATPRITNFRFERLDDSDPLANESYLASVDVTGDAAVRLDTAKAGGTFRLADAVALAAGRALTAESCDRPATLAMGTLTLGEGGMLRGDAKTVVAPETLAGALETVRVEGATLAVSAAQVEARTLKNSDLVLTGGAKVAAPAGRPLALRHVVVDGADVGTGVFTSGTAGWVASGTVALGGGTLMILR
ncbi:MAG: hypothetical protein ACI4RA_05825 [Kiritimatiellia bacterium]